MVNTARINSMTGSATQDGSAQGISFTWDIRSVNSKGCDIRLRVPDWIDGLEAAARKKIGAAIARGSITISLRLSRRDSDVNEAVDSAKLGTITADLATIASHCAQIGLETRAPSLAEIYALPQLTAGERDADPVAFRKETLAVLDETIAAFVQTREEEGAALNRILRAQLDEIDQLVTSARAVLPERTTRQRAALRNALTRLGEETEMDEARLAQELALIAVKSDVAEELDRLDAHVAAARKLLDKGAVIGRRFDFLSQEFNREANTLCAKSQDPQLTEIGLDLKTLIDRMREQIQNVE